MSPADSLRQLHAEWQQRQAELLNGDDSVSAWMRRLYGQQAGAQDEPGQHMPDGLPASPGEVQPAVRPDMSMAEYAQLRDQLGIAGRGLDSGQVQGHGRMDVHLHPQLPGQEHVRAAEALSNPYGQDARAEYSQRQHAAAQAINGFRPRSR